MGVQACALLPALLTMPERRRETQGGWEMGGERGHARLHTQGRTCLGTILPRLGHPRDDGSPTRLCTSRGITHEDKPGKQVLLVFPRSILTAAR